MSSSSSVDRHGESVPSLRTLDRVGVVASPDVNACYHQTTEGRFIFTAAGERVNALETSSGRTKRQLVAPKQYHASDGSPVSSVARVTALACSRDGQVLAAGFSDGAVRLWRKPLKGVLWRSGGGGEREREKEEKEEENEDELYSSEFEDDEEGEMEHCTSTVLFRGDISPR